MAERKPLQLRSERTRGRLVKAAGRVFAERGYAAATIDDVTRAAGCSKGSYYFHFDRKEDVLLVLIEEWSEELLGRLRGMAGEDPSEPDAAGLLRAFLSPDRAEEDDPRLVLEFWALAERSAKVRRALAGAQRSWRDLLVAALRQRRTGGEEEGEYAISPEAAADIALALHDGLLLRSRLGPSSPATWRAATDALAALWTDAAYAKTARRLSRRPDRAAS